MSNFLIFFELSMTGRYLSFRGVVGFIKIRAEKNTLGLVTDSGCHKTSKHALPVHPTDTTCHHHAIS